MWYVYSGSYTKEENALNAGFKLFCKGYDVLCTKTKRFYRLQVGEFESYNNAVNFLNKLLEDGFTGFIDYDKQETQDPWLLSYHTQS